MATILFSIVYSFAMITEIFVPSFFGSIVSAKSESLSYEIFKSNWIPAPKGFKRAIQIYTERTLKPIVILAADIFMLNLITLLKVSRCSNYILVSRIYFQLLFFFSDFEDGLLASCSSKKHTVVINFKQ